MGSGRRPGALEFRTFLRAMHKTRRGSEVGVRSLAFFEYKRQGRQAAWPTTVSEARSHAFRVDFVFNLLAFSSPPLFCFFLTLLFPCADHDRCVQLWKNRHSCHTRHRAGNRRGSNRTRLVGKNNFKKSSKQVSVFLEERIWWFLRTGGYNDRLVTTDVHSCPLREEGPATKWPLGVMETGSPCPSPGRASRNGQVKMGVLTK